MMKMGRVCINTNYRAYQDKINWAVQNKNKRKQQIDNYVV